MCLSLPTPEDAVSFVKDAEAELEMLSHHEDRAAFLNGTDETREHTRLLEEASSIATFRRVSLAKQASRYDGLTLPTDIARKLARIKLAETLPAPSDPAARKELSTIVSTIARNYTAAADGLGEPPGRKKDELYRIMRESRDPAELLSAWKEWRAPGRSIRRAYTRMVEIANKGACELGYHDLGALWRSHYDMASDEFLAEYERLWDQVRPLYVALHCHVRAKLREKYGDLIPETGLIPAHLLGNMWAQFWSGIDDLVGPGGSGRTIDVTALLKTREYTPHKMVWTGEGFFTSLGLERLPSEFWECSMFTKPTNRIVNPQASAWPISPNNKDVRLRMCAEVNEMDFHTIHHELGHIYYYLAYASQPFLFQEGANPGFHEAIGDTIGLSITPEYLKRIELLDSTPGEEEDLPYLFRTALDKIPQLAMAIVVDMWRWKVFSGEVPPERYNAGWWALRNKYQGVSPPSPRTEEDFDPGMFYHVSYNVPYDRYFIAQILQFDFHRALCDAAGQTGSLHRCSIYGSLKAGQRLRAALALGASRPWPDALETLTGTRQIDASSVVKYFEPVMRWLNEQNRGRQCGW